VERGEGRGRSRGRGWGEIELGAESGEGRPSGRVVEERKVSGRDIWVRGS